MRETRRALGIACIAAAVLVAGCSARRWASLSATDSGLRRVAILRQQAADGDQALADILNTEGDPEAVTVFDYGRRAQLALSYPSSRKRYILVAESSEGWRSIRTEIISSLPKFRDKDTAEAYREYVREFPDDPPQDLEFAQTRIKWLESHGPETQRSQEVKQAAAEDVSNKQLKALDDTVRRLGVGDNPKDLYLRIQVRQRSLQKDEFETSPAHAEREARGWALPIVGQRTLEDLYAFRIDSAQAAYDADRETMNVSVSTGQSAGVLQPGVITLTLHTDIWEGKRYVGQSAFGAILSVEKLYSEEYQLQLEPPTFANPFKFEDKMGIDEARRIKPGLGVMAICRLSSPFAAHDGFLKKPTFESPTDMAFLMYRLIGRVEQLWLVDFGRREILRKTSL